MSRLTADRYAEFHRAASLAIAERGLAGRQRRDPGYEPTKPPMAKDPFPWQDRVAGRVAATNGAWPRAIALPTAAGKTACIDIAVFALACQAGAAGARTAPRRIFFVVDRRIVVDQAWLHARALAAVIDRGDADILRLVADQLREIARPGWLSLTSAERERVLSKRRQIQGERDQRKRQKLYNTLDDLERAWTDLRPLDVYALRGGMYRENTWVRSPLQPTVVTSTVDQVGSRLLFRGYGVSGSMAPIHAGLVGNDALILLDEAHCSKPFAETAEAVRAYRGWRGQGDESNAAPEWTPPPFTVVQMTATPAAGMPEGEIERDQEDDRKHPVLGKRINASKPTTLVATDKAKAKNWQEPLVRKLVEQARGLMGRTATGGADEVRAVGVIVNRVATARAVYASLQAAEERKPEEDRAGVILLTGRMRPLDRDQMLHRLRPLFTGSDLSLERPTFVVATQCLEVGADLDFHALVSECASLDALRQRFGRLNRHAQERTFAPGVVVVRADQQVPAENENDQDFVYKNALPKTWKWLNQRAEDGVFDFGVTAVRAVTTDEDLAPLNSPSAKFPALLPAHLDCWVQTAPRPVPDPDPALFLHGEKSGPPDVLVVFRADLGDDAAKWSEIVSLCPPSSSEALPVRLRDFRRWMAEEAAAESSDIEGELAEDDRELGGGQRRAYRWRGAGKKGTRVLDDPAHIDPADTLVIPARVADLDQLGEFPVRPADSSQVPDYGDAAFQRSRDRAILRLTPAVVGQWPDRFRTPAVAAIAARAANAAGDELSPDALDDALRELAAITTDPGDSWAWLPRTATALLPGLTGNEPETRRRRMREAVREVEAHPLGGVVVTGRRRLRQFDPTFADDESSESPTGRPVTLAQHTRDVMEFADRFAPGCGLPPGIVDRFALAARWHDLGKADPRFQAMLRRGSPRSAAGRVLLAKSGSAPGSRREREEERAVHLYPKGGRHELLSLAFAARETDDDLTLHLIGTHHGDCRPFAAPFEDDTLARVRGLLPSDVTLFGERFPWPAAPGDPATANATTPDRFWRVVRAHGWWGAAYLEAMFRLADHAASRFEQEEGWKTDETSVPRVPAVPRAAASRPFREVELTGLDGSNPLAFLAAVGVLQCLTALSRRPGRPDWLGGEVKLSWGYSRTPLGAVLHLAGSPTPGDVATYLAGALPTGLSGHPAEPAIVLMERKDGDPARLFHDLRHAAGLCGRESSDWAVALHADLLSGATSQLLMARRDYFPDNVRSVMRLTKAEHIERALFRRWDYSDPLDNRSLHWEPSEDRRHAYQWHQPNGDPTRGTRGGMLGANRLALEAWPLFLSVPQLRAGKLLTRGFTGDKRDNTFWTWPVWSCPVDLDTVASLLALPELQKFNPKPPKSSVLKAYRVFAAFRSQRILVGKTPNLTPATSV